MNALFTWSTLLAIGLGVSLVLQWTILRNGYRRKVAQQHARLVQAEQSWSGKLAQAKQQIGLLQRDLAAARLECRQIARSKGTPAAAPLESPKESLERKLDEADASRPSVPAHGFPDTQPSPTHFGSLLIR